MTARDARYGRRGGGWVDEKAPSAFDEVYAAERARKAAARPRRVVCPATGCTARLDPRGALCGRHTSMLPPELRAELAAAHVPHHEPTRDERAAVMRAVAWLDAHHQVEPDLFGGGV